MSYDLYTEEDLEKATDEGYQTGYSQACVDMRKNAILAHDNQTLRALLAANARVLKEQIKEEFLDKDKK